MVEGNGISGPLCRWKPHPAHVLGTHTINTPGTYIHTVNTVVRLGDVLRQ